MKALSVWQPWATLVAIGVKKFETRSWGTTYRGEIAIDAAKKITEWQEQFIDHPVVHQALGDFAWRLPLGAIIAVADLIEVIPVEKAIKEIKGTPEEFFGDYTHGRFAWRLGNVRLLETPIQYRGRQRLFEVDEKLT